MGYSNVTGDLNVYSVTSTRDLTVRRDTALTGNLTVSGSASFQNLIASNLTVTNVFTITATNTSISNALTINNSGTATALFVNQNEYPAMVHNVAEFYDHSTPALIIDPDGNLAIHTTTSPGYALTLVEGALMDNIRVTGSYTGSGAGLTNVPVTGLSGSLVASQLQNTQINITAVGTLVTFNVAGVSNLNGSILGTLATPAQPNITSVGLLSNLAISNSISVSNIVATGNLSVQTQTNLFSANILTENVLYANVVTSNIVNLNVSSGANVTYLTVSTLSNSVSSNILTANIRSANVVTENVQVVNVSTGANITTLTVSTLANIISANLITANIGSANLASGNISILNVSGTANIITLNVGTANIQTENVVSLNVSSGANVTTLTVSTLANIFSSNTVTANITTLNAASLIIGTQSNALTANLVTANIQTANIQTGNVVSLNVSSGANITYLTVSTLANLVSANLVTANVGTANLSTANISILNVTTLTVSTLANIVSANVVTLNVGSANVSSSNISILNVNSGANITTLTVSTLANITSANLVTANVGTANLSTANISILNVNSGANITTLTISTQANISSANLVTANIATANVTTMNLLNLNVTSTANFSTANFVSANIANIYTTNILGFVGSQWVGLVGGPLYYPTGNVGINTSTGIGANLTVSGNLYVSANVSTPILNVTSYANVSVLNVSTSANIITANVVTANIANIYTTNIVGFVGSQWVGQIGQPIYYASGNVAIGSSTSNGANLTVTGNIFASNAVTTTNIFTNNLTATGTITGSWTGTSQGTLLTLATNTATGTAFATSTDAPTLQAYHVPLQSFTQNAIQAVSGYTITAQGLIKFSSTGLYQVTMALVMDSPVVKVALGTNSTSVFPSSTSAYTYVYTISSAASPSDCITIPINVQNIANYYYLDVFCRSSVTSGTYYLTAGTTVTGSQSGTYIQIAPFGNYISTTLSAAAGLVVSTSGSTLSSPLVQASPLTLASNTYHVPLTSAAGWTTAGTSSTLAISSNGNLQFYQAGLFQVTLCLNATSQFLMQIGVGSSSSDSSLPSTIGPYVYQYRPSVTQDPTATIVLPLNITDITKYYYLDATFGPSTTVALVSTSTFVMVTPVGSYIPSPMATASLVVSQVVTAQSTSYTALSTDSYIGMSNGGVVTLPQGATLTRGKVYTIKEESGKAGTNTSFNIIIQTQGVDTIDGQANVYVQLGYTSVNVMWTGANNKWSLI